MSQDALSKAILDSAFRVHSALGPGLFEHVYEVILAYELCRTKHHRGAEVGRSTAADSLEAAFYPAKTKGLSPWSID